MRLLNWRLFQMDILCTQWVGWMNTRRAVGLPGAPFMPKNPALITMAIIRGI